MMEDAEEIKRFKARQIRYKRPIVKDLNLDTITQDLWDIREECENIRWYTDSEDGTDSLMGMRTKHMNSRWLLQIYAQNVTE